MKLLWTEERKNCFEKNGESWCPFLWARPYREKEYLMHNYICKKDQHVVFIPPDDEIPEDFVPTPENLEALKIKQNQEWEEALKKSMECLVCPLEVK